MKPGLAGLKLDLPAMLLLDRVHLILEHQLLLLESDLLELLGLVQVRSIEQLLELVRVRLVLGRQSPKLVVAGQKLLTNLRVAQGLPHTPVLPSRTSAVSDVPSTGSLNDHYQTHPGNCNPVAAGRRLA
jgi:hypothetical protein